MSIVERAGRKPHCSYGSIHLGLAVVAEAGLDHFQQYFAGVGNKRIPSVVVAVRAILLLTEDFDGRIFPLLGDFSRSPHIDK